MEYKGLDGKLMPHPPMFRLFTRESLTKISKRIQEEKLAKELLKQQEQEQGQSEEKKFEEEKPRPNPLLMQGMTLPTKMGEFPPEMCGMPIEDIDEYYHNKYTFVVVAKDKTIFRFSSSNGFFFLSPFNPLRRIAIYILTHPFFSLCVMLVILVNCVFMAINKEIPHTEATFTGIYTVEGTIKMLARGFILADFTYLRDAWNWLDFMVVSFAYMTMALGDIGGKVAVLRTFRVLRALKTVAVVPGLKTIVGALMEAVRRLRDVAILSLFVLSIFALIGLQLYQGSLMKKCILMENQTWFDSLTKDEKRNFAGNRSHWEEPEKQDGRICGDSGSQCHTGYACVETGQNPDFNFTTYDNFGWALLCAFRLMTQDYWENLYQLTIKANGPGHMLFFIIVIFLGSFYLVNLILAIVAMSYDDCRRQDREQEEQEELEEQEEAARLLEMEENANAAMFMVDMKLSPSDLSSTSFEQYCLPKKSRLTDKESISMKSECGLGYRRRLSIVNSAGKKSCTSLPGSPNAIHQGSQFMWSQTGSNRPAPKENDRRPLVLPCLENVDLPYADDSALNTPTSEELCNYQNAQNFLTFKQRLNSMSHGNGRMSQIESRFAATAARKASYISSIGEFSPRAFDLQKMKAPNRKCEPTHFHWTTSARQKAMRDSDNSAVRKIEDVPGHELDSCKGKLFLDNPFICLTPSPSAVDLRDILVLKDLINHASGKKNFLGMEEGQSKKEFFKNKCNQLLFGWECCSGWYQFAHIIELFIMDAFVDLFITLCIVINTLFMAMEHDGMTSSMIATLKYGNYVFTGIFTVEAVLKILALGLYKYLEDKWSCFDIVIVILSLIELGLSGVKGLSILRSFRLLRVFKLAKSWPTLNLLIGIIGRTMGALGNLCFVLAIIIFIFAVMGMQLFGPNYDSYFGSELPGWNFCDFLHSFMIVFRVLCGEWIESMWNCIRCNGSICIPFFLLTMIIGNLVVLNLFLALLLSSFGAESLKHTEEDEGPNKLQEAIDRINRFIVFIKSNIFYCVKVGGRRTIHGMHDCDSSLTKAGVSNMDGGGQQYGNGRVRGKEVIVDEFHEDGDHQHQSDVQALTYRLVKGTPLSHVGYSPVSSYEPEDVQTKDATKENFIKCDQPCSAKACKAVSHLSLESTSDSSTSSSTMSKSRGSQKSMLSSSNFSYSAEDVMSTGKLAEGPEIHEVKVVFIKYPDNCCPQCCGKACACLAALEHSGIGKAWWTYRFYMFKLVENNYFETFIIIMILLSSLALAAEDVDIEKEDRRWLWLVLKVMDKMFTVIFVFEMFIKQSAYGFKKYFTDAWCWLDFVIVVISLLSLFAESAGYGNIGAFRALRTLRALRPLRAVSRWEGMKVVVNALIQAIPAIFNVLLVCLVFWLIFSIMGVNLFGGKFKQCVDIDGVRVNASEVSNKSDCEARRHLNYTWFNPKINFDNVLSGYLALFQVATFKGWIDIMDNSINSKPEEDQQPEFEYRSGMYMYFVFFIVFGSFFTLNLFIGVIIENFNMQKKKAGGSLEMLMTEDQKKYYNAMKKLGSKQPQKPIPKPKIKLQLLFFQVTTSQKFDIFIMIVILLNMMTMAIEHYDQSEELDTALKWINPVFVLVFTCECIMKLFGLRHYYFKQPWNIFDFIVVISSVLTSVLSDYLKNFPISPTLLRVVRVFRVGRILRLVKSAKGIRTLLFSLAVSMPALFNIGLLLFLVMFIYAIFGMSFFMHVKHTKGIDDMFNFETFFRSMILLFQISTSAGWDGVLAGLMNDEDCDEPKTDTKPNGDCGSPGEAVVYLVTYLVISFLVVINMYIAVILENFSQATEDVQQGLTQDDFDMYYEVWEKYDENATQYIHLRKLCEFVDALEEPLRIPAPNYYRLVSLDIPICEDDMMHCVDILDGLAKNFLGTADQGDLGDIKKGPERKNYNPVSSTLKRQREIFVVRLLQQTWRNYVLQKQSIKAHTIITIDDIDEGEEPVLNADGTEVSAMLEPNSDKNKDV